MKKILNFLLLFISFVLISISFYFIGLNYLIFIAYIPLFLWMNSHKFCNGKLYLFLIVLYAALSFFINKVSVEVNASFLTYFGLFFALSSIHIIIFIGLRLFFRNFYKLFFKKIYHQIFKNYKENIPLIFLLSQLLFELVMTKGILAFPWFNVSLPVSLYKFFISDAVIFGGTFISMKVLLINYFSYELIKYFSNYKFAITEGQKKYLNLNITIAFIVIIVIFLFSVVFYKFNPYDKKLIKSDLIVAAAQPDIPLNFKYKEEYFYIAIQRLTSLTIDAAEKKVDLIVWPETAFAAYFRYENKYRKLLQDIAKEYKIGIVLGFPDTFVKNGKRYHYNSATYIDKNGNIHQFYNKIQLVPFGEYIPLSDKIHFLKKIAPEVGINQDRGKINSPYVIEKNGEKYYFYPTICYEALFSDLFRKFRDNKAKFFLNLTNDSWYEGTYEQKQHLYLNVLRAVEFKTTIARSDTTGISAIIYPDGSIVNKLNYKEKGIVYSNVIFYNNGTFYERYGYILLLVYKLIFLIFFVAGYLLEVTRIIYTRIHSKII